MNNENNIEVNYKKLDLEELKLNSQLQKKKSEARTDLFNRGTLTNGALNEFDNYEYFSESQYKLLFNELFSKYKLEFRSSEISKELFTGTDKQPFGVILTIACTIMDIESGYEETTYHSGIAIDKGDKAIYKARTGALKSFFANTFWVATHDDPEREDDSPKKPVYKSRNYTETKKTSGKAGSITKGQITMIKSLFESSKEELKEMMTPYNKKKIEELTIEEASAIISQKKRSESDE